MEHNNGGTTLPWSSNHSGFLDNSTFYPRVRSFVNPASYKYIRNFIIGIIGLIANCLAVVAVTRAKKIKRSLKIYLISLSLNDIIFMMVLTLPVWSETSRHITCAILALCSVSPFAVSNLTTALISFHNYQAVMKPLKFQSAVPTRRVFVIVVALWLIGWSLSLMSIGSIQPQNGECRPALKIPKFVYVLSSVINAITVVSVLVFNMIVVYSLKTGSHMPQNSGSVSHCTNTSNIIKLETDLPSSLSDQTNSPKQMTWSSDCCQTLEADSSSARCLLHVECGSYVAQHLPVTGQCTSHKRERIKRLVFSCETKFRSIAITPANENLDAHVCRVSHSRLKETEGEQGTSTMESLSGNAVCSSANVGQNIMEKEKCPTSFTIKNDKTNCVSQTSHEKCRFRISSTNTGNNLISTPSIRQSKCTSGRSIKIRKIGTSLCIITLWSCSLCVPNFVFTMLSVAQESGREQLDSSGFSVASTTLIMVNCLSNPLIYAWRFVDWSGLCLRLRQIRH